MVEFVLVSPELQTHAANIQCEKKPNVDKVNLDVRKKEGKLITIVQADVTAAVSVLKLGLLQINSSFLN